MLTDEPTGPSGESNGRVAAVVNEEVANVCWATAPVPLVIEGEREIRLEDNPGVLVVLVEDKTEDSPIKRGAGERVLWLPDSKV